MTTIDCKLAKATEATKRCPQKAMLASSQPRPQLSVASKLLARTMPAIFPSHCPSPPPFLALRCFVTFLLSAFWLCWCR